jgi:nicotine blue oxidoreductase
MPKALVTHGGRLFVASAAGVLRAAGCEPVIVVLGASAAEVRSRTELSGCVVVDNPGWPAGMGSSLRVGLNLLRDDATTSVVVLPVDTPGVTSAAIARLMAVASPHALARATYHGMPGHPVLLGRAHWAGVLESATGDVGARDYLRTHPVQEIACDDVAIGTDVDGPQDLDTWSAG